MHRSLNNIKLTVAAAVWMVFLSSTITGCSQKESTSNPRITAKPVATPASSNDSPTTTSSSNATNPTNATNSTNSTESTASTIDPVTPSVPAANTINPILLAPGWGWNIPGLMNHETMINRFVADGFPKERIHFVPYTYRGTLDEVYGEMSAELSKIFASYPEGTKFDMVGFSTGGFTGMYTLMLGNFDNRIEKFISLSSIGHGIDRFEMLIPGLAELLEGTSVNYAVEFSSGKTINAISPYMNSFVSNFYTQYATRISKLKKCSIFSSGDGFIVPYDSGRFADGENHDVPDLYHLFAMLREGHYQALKTLCFKVDKWN